jgi:hypothetical protein
MKVLELRGIKSLRALNAFHALMLGLKMLPAYMGETYEEFFARVSLMPEADQEKLIREAATFVEIQKDEVEAMLSFCCDANGVPYSAENVKNLGPREMHEAIVAVCKQIAKIRIDLVGEAQKKNSNGSQ